MSTWARVLLVAAAFGGMGSMSAQTGTALVRHAPTLNGTVEGSVQQLTAEDTTLNGGAAVVGDLFIPGTPVVRLNGQPTYFGTLDALGAATPSSHRVTLNGQAALRHVVRRTDPVALPTVNPPPAPTGTRVVTLTNPGESPGDFATLRDLALSSGVGAVAIPAGTYGTFTAGPGSGFVLGTAGATTPSTYNFQALTLQAGSTFEIVGPVVVTLAAGVATNASMGHAAHPEWLVLRFASGGLEVAGQRAVYAQLEAPSGALTLQGDAQFVGAVAADQLAVNGNALLRLVAATTANQPPGVSLTSPAHGATFTAPASFALVAAASDADGSIVRVEFFAGTTLLGEDTSVPYEFALSALGAGTHSFSARATDNQGAITDSAAITVTVTQPNQPPAVTLTAPADGALLTAPATVALAATATDADGSIAKVEFYEGTTLLGEDASAPYELTTAPLTTGTYVFRARAVDNLGAATSSPSATVTVIAANQSPAVSLTAPADGSVFTAPAAFTLEAAASDPDGTVAKVEFFQDAVLIGEDTAAPFAFAVSDLAAGTHHYVARATDNVGSATDSAPIRVTVHPAVSFGLPFLAGFEATEGYALGAINGQQGWTASSSAIVTDADFASGERSVLVPDANPRLTLARSFDAHLGEPVVFVDLYVLPRAGATLAESVQFDALDAMRVGLVRDGSVGRFQVLAGDGVGSGTWTAVRGSVPVDAGGVTTDWVRLTLRGDYAAKRWDLYVGGVMAAADVNFLKNTAAALGSFTLTGAPETTGGSPVLFDDFLAAFDNPLFVDADRDGMEDAWETAHLLNPTLDDRGGDPDGDGLTNVREYLLGTNPNNADSDGDGMPDGWEALHGLDGTVNEAGGDLDADGVNNLREFQQGRNPTKAAVPDTTGAVNLRVYQPSR